MMEDDGAAARETLAPPGQQERGFQLLGIYKVHAMGTL